MYIKSEPYSASQLEAFAQDGLLCFSQSRCLEEVYQEVLQQICDSTGWSIGHVYLSSSKLPDELTSASIRVLKEPEKFELLCQVTKALKFVRGVGLPGRALESGVPEWVADIRAADRSFVRGRLALEEGLLSSLALPVKRGENVVAVLEFFSEKVMDPDSTLIDVLVQIGAKLGAIIEFKSKAAGSSPNEANRN